MIEVIFYWIGMIVSFLFLVLIILLFIEWIYDTVMDAKLKRENLKRVWFKALNLVHEEMWEEKKVK